MAKAKVFTGARAKVYVDDVLVGVFDSCSYAVNVGAEPIHILGRYSPAEITPTSYEAVTVNCSGFRVIGNGGHVLPKVPKLQDLLQLEYVKLDLLDRQGDTAEGGGNSDNRPVMTVENCVPINYSTGANAKATSRIQVTYLGTHAYDESGDQNEGGAVELP
jgi:hypothetical protein